MVNLFRVSFMVLLIIVVARLAALLQPEGARDLGLETWTWTALKYDSFGDPQWCLPNREEMERAEAKNAVIVALLEGRLTLFEAAAHFRRLKHPRTDLNREYRGSSEEECLCRQVIRSAGVDLLHIRGQKAAAAELTARLEEELRLHLEKHGQGSLPNVDPALDAPTNALPWR
jgi:hypothetical protein